jgi:hypothetical protein
VKRTGTRRPEAGTIPSTTTRANGKTAEGTYSVDGTRTGLNGRVTDVDKTIARNPDGSTSVDSVYANPEGKTDTVDKPVSSYLVDSLTPTKHSLIFMSYE